MAAGKKRKNPSGQSEEHDTNELEYDVGEGSTPTSPTQPAPDILSRDLAAKKLQEELK